MPSIILSDNGVSSGSAGIKTSGSNDGTLALQTTTSGGTATTAQTIGTDQVTTFAQAANLPNTFGFKNRLINGQMMIDQRNAGAAKTMSSTSNGYAIDRWTFGYVTSGVGTVQQVFDGPTGFAYSMKYTTTTATTSNDYTYIDQPVEAGNCFDFAWGTSSGAATTLSFWVKANNAGTYSASIRFLGGSTTYYYNVSYVISAANTWQYVTLSIPAPPSAAGAFTNAMNLEYLQVEFLITSSGFTGTATSGAWTTSTNRKISGTYDLASTLNATWQITGIQLEKGAAATSFDFRPYGTELALCQRYYWAIGNFAFTGSTNYTHVAVGTARSSTAGYVVLPFPVQMRSAPSFSSVNYTNFLIGQGGINLTALNLDIAGTNTASFDVQWSAGGTFSTNSACRVYASTSTCQIQLSAEL